eukprot:6068176-Alexandrium_andersonii.AAC.2
MPEERAEHQARVVGPRARLVVIEVPLLRALVDDILKRALQVVLAHAEGWGDCVDLLHYLACFQNQIRLARAERGVGEPARHRGKRHQGIEQALRGSIAWPLLWFLCRENWP